MDDPNTHATTGTDTPEAATTVLDNHTNADAAPADVVSEAPKESRPRRDSSGEEDEAQAMVISSLRTQIQDLYSQVTGLNTKLVASYDRVSDLEDNLHYLAALNTGLLVERAHVTSELTRLMEKATEEAAQRGQAESARTAIEKDLDDLSASLFDQANTMVAEARYAGAMSERKVEESQAALHIAEEALGVMQLQLQSLQAEKEKATAEAERMRALMEKGKWVQRAQASPVPHLINLLSSHMPYQEFLLFVAHLRSIHPSSPQIPAMSTLLPLPFLTRLMNEDSYVARKMSCLSFTRSPGTLLYASTWHRLSAGSLGGLFLLQSIAAS
ncbi:hypothetical protein FISHEDRAFT_45147 [Fistulina hepatica ATCC 64428]|uniref:GDP/GTP exchange factor Sec2 N-terminal domain-containing protein n=1 Tax=Fistulina hepatica ATCC 64428 TaxID=1128425 RepID=A0A0D7AAQ3_9AGAR|nr:hypothetical protein FISHEDRAFT_45147 [Fistulina hepatica ATCC 64428]